MYRVVTDIGEVRKYLSEARIIAFDFETAPDNEYRDEEKAALDPHKSHIVGVSFSTAENDAIYVPIAHRIGTNADPVATLAMLVEFAFDETIIKVAHNLSFESMFLYKHGIVLQPPCYDTIAASQLTLKSHTVFRKLADSGLKTLVRELLPESLCGGTSLPNFTDVTGGRLFDELDPEEPETIRYACADSDYTLRLYHLFNNWFDRYLPKHRSIVEQLESPTSVYCGLMKFNGLLVDAATMEQQRQHAKERLAEIRENIAFMIGDINIGANASTSAFKKYLYSELQLPVLKTTAKYQESIDDEALVLLSEWCAANRPELVPLFKLVQDYRRWGKIESTYIEGYSQHISNATGRIHADLFPLGTETGRFAARRPNLQNMPRPSSSQTAHRSLSSDDESSLCSVAPPLPTQQAAREPQLDDVGIRNFFIAPEDKTLLSLDFSQIELRVGAFYCRDEKMLETYRTGGDIHDQTATVIYGIGKHNKEQRTIAKNVNFGTFFGLFPRGLQRTLKFKAGLDKPLAECEQIIANLKTGYPNLVTWQKKTKAHARVFRYAETLFGRRRYLTDICSTDWSKRSFAERCALNTPIQGTAADILKLALGRIIAGLPERPWLRPLLQIHDELVFELPIDRVNEAALFIKDCMEKKPFSEFDVPIIAEAAVGVRFGELQELEVKSDE